jgi:LPXTG-motif cell wall-anchored protein
VLLGGAGLLGATAANADPKANSAADPATVAVTWTDTCTSVIAHLTNNAATGGAAVNVQVSSPADTQTSGLIDPGASKDVEVQAAPGDTVNATVDTVPIGSHTNQASGCGKSGTATIAPDCNGNATVTVTQTGDLPIDVTVAGTPVHLVSNGDKQDVKLTGLAEGASVAVTGDVTATLTYHAPTACTGGGGGNNNGGNDNGGNNNGGSDNNSSGGGGSLPTTGGSTGLLVGGGGLLLLAGGVLMVVSRRRRQGTTEEA